MDDYDDVHRLQFDLETEGLFASSNAIFQIGIRDNRGLKESWKHLVRLALKTDNLKEITSRSFKVIDAIQPDIITGYNSESFDWLPYFQRAERLNMDVTDVAITLNRISKLNVNQQQLNLVILRGMNRHTCLGIILLTYHMLFGEQWR
jgi:DNA polymerase elongation subunit (family B)